MWRWLILMKTAISMFAAQEWDRMGPSDCGSVTATVDGLIWDRWSLAIFTLLLPGI
jgi:hypothetical protein